MSPQTATPEPPGAAPGGDPAPDSVLEDAYRAHADAVLALARQLVVDPCLAEEVCQEVFLRLWHRPDRFDAQRGTLRAFLLAECHGRSVDAIRSESARRRREERVAEADRRGLVGDVATRICDLAVAEQAAELVRALPDVEREAISLACCTDISYREAAAALGEPEGTVKCRIRTGLRRLRSQMRELDIVAR